MFTVKKCNIAVHVVAPKCTNCYVDLDMDNHMIIEFNDRMYTICDNELCINMFILTEL